MKYALIGSNNIVVNVIEYDGIAPYTPADGLFLEQVNAWVKIGDDKNTPEHEPAEPELPPGYVDPSTPLV